MIVANSFKTPTLNDAVSGHDSNSNLAPRLFALSDIAALIAAAGLAGPTGPAGAPQALTTTADRTGATDATAQLQADLATAVATGHKRLYLPAGTYKISATTGNVLDLGTTAGVEVFGDGIGKTILQFADNVTLAGSVYIITLHGAFQQVRDLSIAGGANTTPGSHEQGGVFADATASDTLVDRIEVSGMVGTPAGGNGFCFGAYRPWNQADRTTPLTAAISSTGSQTATPASMRGIVVGGMLLVGAEYVTVTAKTATTFTATFAATHAIGTTVTLPSFGFHRATFRDCIARDSYYATGFGVNSNGNTYIRCRVLNVGDTTLRHGFYIQGGSGLFLGCWVEGVAGYSYHGWKKVPNIESGGDIFLGCVSRQPATGAGHMIISGLPSDGTNPSVPNGYNLDRYTQVIGCAFRGDTPAICSFANPVLFANNICENTFVSDNGRSTITQNQFTRTAFSALTTAYTALTIGAGSVATGNQIDLGSLVGQAGINVVGADAIVTNNAVRALGASTRAIVIAATRVRCHDNYVENDQYQAISINGSIVIDIANNTIAGGSGAALLFTGGGVTGSIRQNNILSGSFRADGVPEALRIEGNTGPINANGRTASTMCGTEKHLRAALLASGTVANGLLVKWSAGQLVKIGTSDAAFAGVSYGEALNPGEGVVYASEGGAAVDVVCDGAWTIGNVAIASTTTAGNIHDSGVTTAPASGSYGVFLDSGGGAGVARVLLVRTL